jgi:ring-1,2-phenylacetyl-CoA epoxidase subunit PaaD
MEWLAEVSDPEIPVLTILDMGIVRDIKVEADAIEVFITPTYSGCPAMDAITFDIKLKLIEKGFKKVKVTTVLSPAWTTDWMSENGKKKLQEYGIAPPQTHSQSSSQQRINRMLFAEEEAVICPRCKSDDTRLLSQFGSTACKALYQCNNCKEPFDYFKCH